MMTWGTKQRSKVDTMMGPPKKYYAWKNKLKYMGPKNFVKPLSHTNAATINKSVVCEKFVVLQPPRRMKASSLLAN